MLTWARTEVFNHKMQDVCDYVLSKKDMKDKKDNQIPRAVIETLPTLAKYNKNGSGLVDFLDKSIKFLIDYIKKCSVNDILIILV